MKGYSSKIVGVLMLRSARYGISVGFDHRGQATLIENEVRDNRSRGVFVASSDNVVVRGNTESNNLNLPPTITPSFLNPRNIGNRTSRKYLRRVKKNEDSIKKTVKEDSVFN